MNRTGILKLVSAAFLPVLLATSACSTSVKGTNDKAGKQFDGTALGNKTSGGTETTGDPGTDTSGGTANAAEVTAACQRAVSILASKAQACGLDFDTAYSQIQSELTAGYGCDFVTKYTDKSSYLKECETKYYNTVSFSECTKYASGGEVGANWPSYCRVPFEP
ncbi:MAG: hypothetical protein U0169_04160 [Polyangiaceae bacterium]